MVPMASQNGVTKITSSAIVMIVTARARLPHSFACTARMSGQVAMTKVIAQIVAGRKGCKIHRLVTIRPPMTSTPSVRCARSYRTDCGSMALS